MKKLLFILAFSMLTFVAAKAQSNVKLLVSTNSTHAWYAGLDTNSNTGTTTQLLQISGKGQLTFQTGVTKLTGTPTGVLKLLGSNDGVKYDYANGVPDSLIVANKAGVQVKSWFINPSRFYYYKVVYIGAGTQTSTISSNVLIR